MIAVNVVNFLFWWQYYVSENRRREAAFVASGLSAEERGAQNRANGENDLTDMQVRGGIWDSRIAADDGRTRTSGTCARWWRPRRSWGTSTSGVVIA